VEAHYAHTTCNADAYSCSVQEPSSLLSLATEHVQAVLAGDYQSQLYMSLNVSYIQRGSALTHLLQPVLPQTA
jgi:hypothetical protein